MIRNNKEWWLSSNSSNDDTVEYETNNNNNNNNKQLSFEEKCLNNLKRNLEDRRLYSSSPYDAAVSPFNWNAEHISMVAEDCKCSQSRAEAALFQTVGNVQAAIEYIRQVDGKYKGKGTFFFSFFRRTKFFFFLPKVTCWWMD